MIAFNYKESMEQSKELTQLSTELQDLVNRKLSGQLSELECAWKGESASLFLQKAEELFGDISKTAKKAAGIAKAVETAAKAIKAAEDAAEQLVKTVASQ